MSVEIDQSRLMADLEELGQIGLSPRGGLMRVAFSEVDGEGRAWVTKACGS